VSYVNARQNRPVARPAESSLETKDDRDRATPSADLKPAPIAPDWISGRRPKARSNTGAKAMTASRRLWFGNALPDGSNWHYSEDETVVVISGEAVISTEKGEERTRPRRYGILPRWQFLHMVCQRNA